MPSDTPTERPPSHARPTRVPHAKDGPRQCARCGETHHYFEGTQVWPASDAFGDDAGESMWELVYATCGECRSTGRFPHRVRLELDGESTGWIVERRDGPAPLPVDMIAGAA